MRRIQGSFATRDPEEEKRKTREAVLSNLFVFGAIIGMIRTGIGGIGTLNNLCKLM